MAIIIPSKNIYDKQNPKVRDNVIERIEVGAVEVIPDNEYDEPIHSKKIYPNDWDTYSQKNSEIANYQWMRSSFEFEYSIANARTKMSRMYASGRIYIKKSQNNHLITDLFSGTDNDGNSKIKYSSRCILKTGDISLQETVSFTIEEGRSSAELKDITISETSITDENRLIKEEENGVFIPDTSKFDPKNAITYSQNYYTPTGDNVISTTTFPDTHTNLSSVEIKYDENSDDYYFDYVVLCGIIFDRYGFSTRGTYTMTGTMGATEQRVVNVKLTGTTEYYYPETIEITVYGNTIGIDLKDKTVYINGQTSKKVYSVDRNELMQTTNYFQDTGESAIEKMFGDAKTAYEKGKETAVIRCSISDYFYDDGIKEIAIDNSTDKMMFEEYDRVIPMVYGNNGDSPMSLNKDGTPKEFFVLGVRPYYDGAVWQELHLQEAEKGIDFWSFSVSYIDTQGSDYIRLRLIGKGDIYTNGELFSSIDTQEEVSIRKETREVQNVVLVGDFSYIKVEGTSVTVLHWNKYARTIYNSMFAYDILNDFTIPSHIVEIGMRAFDNATIEEITIPKSIRKIGNAAFSACTVNTVRFMHGAHNKIELPVAGSTGAFYCKSAKEMTIYTDNLTIKNYDWVADNITPTFYHLDGTAWS